MNAYVRLYRNGGLELRAPRAPAVGFTSIAHPREFEYSVVKRRCMGHTLITVKRIISDYMHTYIIHNAELVAYVFLRERLVQNHSKPVS
jgi:hypothetical protein